MNATTNYPPLLISRPQRKYEALLLAKLLAIGAIALQYVVRYRILTVYNDTLLGHLLNILRDSLVLLPAALVATTAGLWLARRLEVGRSTWRDLLQRAAIISLLFALLLLLLVLAAPLVSQMLAAGGQFDHSLLVVEAARSGWGVQAVVDALRDVLLVQTVAFPLAMAGLLFVAWRRGERLESIRREGRRRRGLPPRETVLLLAAVMAFGIVVATSLDVPQSHAQVPALNACTDGVSPVRTYDVSAIHVDITLNQYGDHDPSGYMFVLTANIPAVRAQEAARTVSGGLRDDAIQPLVIRANLGECLVVNFTNELITDASMHIHGLPFTVDNAGGEVGTNLNTAVAPGGTITYRWPIPTDAAAEASYYFHSHGSSRQQTAHGLFGSLIVEPAGSQYLHPETRQPLLSGWEAIIQDPSGVDFREFALIFHEVGDEAAEIFDQNGFALPVIDGLSGAYRPGSRAINYRSEPFYNRFKLRSDAGLPFDKAHGYSSYAYGDPATPIPRSYLGEPTKMRLMHGGSEVFHVYHLHGGAIRWRRNPEAEPNEFTGGLKKTPTQNAHATRLDSQSMGPSESFNLEIECGAGGCQQAAGDFLWHCHIGHHYVAGMWSFWRVFDTEQADLAVLPDRDPTAVPPQPVNSLGLIGRVIEGKTLVPTAVLTDTVTQRSLEEWVESQLPPPGTPIDLEDATVWDWQLQYVNGDPTQPLYLGEPETTQSWPNYSSATPGVRPEILFNPGNGRYTWPLFKPHLGKRPPFAGNGHSGAPWLGEDGSATRPDGLCPVGAPNTRYYPITAIEMPIQITDVQTDPTGMLFVLSEEKDAIRNGLKPAEPLVIRSNVGDCVDIILTSEQLDINHGGRAKVNMHSHFVQFDPQASDGVITGFSYEQSIRPYATENRTLTVAAIPGTNSVIVNQVTRLRPGIDIGIGLGDYEVEIRRIVSITGNTITLDQPLTNAHPVGAAVGVEFVRYRWYSDVDSGTVFFHDHVNFKNWDHGLFGAHIVEPDGSTYHDPVTGVEVRSGTIVDIRNVSGGSAGAGQVGSFREFFVAIHNGSPATGVKAGSTINLRAEPFGGRGGNNAYLFSSVLHGDPKTPVFRAYLGDPVVMRGLGVVERVGALRLTGHRFRVARFAGEGALTDAMNLDISERTDVILEGGAGGVAGLPGDYLYYSTVARDFDGGAWGLLRVHDTLQPTLQVLPGMTPPPNQPGGFPQQTFTGSSPQPAADPGQVCPVGAPVRSYEVSVFHAPIPFHSGLGGTDLEGILYALAKDEQDILNGVKPVEPLVLRVNAGECLEIGLTNHLGGPASLNLGKLLFDPQGSNGAAVGYNLDSTVGPNQRRLYRYFADIELGTSIMLNLADPDLGARGAFGAVVVEPTGAIYRNPNDGSAVESGVSADIITANESFREFVALFQDEDRRLGQNTMPYPTEVNGFTGINYRADPLFNRLLSSPSSMGVFDSDVHGDPANLLDAYTGDAVRFRFAQPWGEQAHVFSMEGHRWPLEPFMVGTSQISSKSLRPGEAFDGYITGGAGGGIATAGDYLFQDHRMPFLEAGLWGILRVHDVAQPTLLDLPVPGTNIAPVAGDDEAETKDTAVTINVLVNDYDADGTLAPASIFITNPPLNGTAVANLDGTITYTPTVGFIGEDAFRYTVNDNLGATSNPADVTVEVTGAANNPPVANNDSAVTNEDAPISINVTANDVDIDGAINHSSVTIVTPPLNGTLLNQLDGTLTYTPTLNYTGNDSFQYTVTDDMGALSNVATVNITVLQNIPPIAVEDAASTSEGSPVIIFVLSNDLAIDRPINPASVTIVTPPTNGTAVANINGTITYTPAAGFSGSDSLQYTIDDDKNVTSNAAVVNITVTPAGQNIPIANAGPDQLVDLGQLIQLNGQASTGQGLQFSWQQISGPPVALSGANTATPTFVFTVEGGFYIFELTVTDINGLTSSDTVSVMEVVLQPPPSLKSLAVPEPDNLMNFVQDRNAAIALGKALFWDMQVGSDGVQACATCHYHAGTDNRPKNTLNPSTDAVFNLGSPNYVLQPGDFPFHKLADPLNPLSPVLFDTDDVIGSQGVTQATFNGIVPGSAVDNGTPTLHPLFNLNGVNTRQVTGRNTPSVINAVFNVRNFWDGRANFIFNGVNPFGLRDPSGPTIYEAQPGGGLLPVSVQLNNASLASQAVGPPNNGVEMAWDGRTFPELGQKVFSLRPLAQQAVHPNDSVLGGLADPSGTGLSTTYADLIRAAFQPKYWDSPDLVNGQYDLMEANFSLFFGLAIQMYEASLVSDDTPYDRFQEGDPNALTQQQQNGLQLFIGKGQCIICHSGSLFSAATINTITDPAALGPEPAAVEALLERMRTAGGNLVTYDNGFYNIGVRPILEDLGVGGLDPFGNPLSFTRLAQQGIPIGPPFAGNPPIGPNEDTRGVDGAFKTPILRNVELTAPYMHNGGMSSLEQVVDFYSRGSDFHDQNINSLARAIGFIGFTPQEKADLVAFLKSLTDERVRLQQAPFDHPQLFIPNGHLPDGSDELLEIPAVGVAGGPPLEPFVNINPGLVITNTVAPSLVRSGDTVTFTVMLENTGDVRLDHLTVSSDLPGCTFTGPSSDAWASNVLDVTESWTFTCAVSVTQTVTNTVTVTAEDRLDNPISVSAGAMVTVIHPAIQVVKQPNSNVVNVGQSIVYTYTVTNTGDSGLTSITAVDDRLGAITLGSTTLLPGESTSGNLSYAVVESDLPGPITNTVVVTGTPLVGPDVSGSDIASVDLTSHPAIQMV
ncbi:MAG: Ig-like domain-containing protein, partial [Anaerolineae bacterium]